MRPLAKLLLILGLIFLIGLIGAAIILTLYPAPPPPSDPLQNGSLESPLPAPPVPPPDRPSPAHTSPPPALSGPGNDHDRWQTRPLDISRSFTAFTLSFDGPDDNDGDNTPDAWAIPEWVAYRIDAHPDPLGKGPDRPRWTTDADLYAKKIAPADASYSFSNAFRTAHPDSDQLGYDRGHMCMKYHAFRLGETADAETHTMLNACPQKHEFNAGIWLDLEEKTGVWADRYGTVWIVCGPILTGRRVNRWLGEPGEVPVAIPDGFFKIVVRPTADADRPAVLAFIFPHEVPAWKKHPSGTPWDLAPFLSSVDEIERQTGLDFLTVLSPENQAAVESAPAAALWP